MFSNRSITRRTSVSFSLLAVAGALAAGCAADPTPEGANVSVDVDEVSAQGGALRGNIVIKSLPPPASVGIIRAPLLVHNLVVGRLTCSAPDGAGRTSLPLPQVPLEVPGVAGGKTKDDGSFALSGAFLAGSPHFKVVYDGSITTGAPGAPSSRLQVMDDVHNTRSEEFDRDAVSSTATTLDLGTIELSSTDCELWRIGSAVLTDFHATTGASPPAGQLRMLRWSAVSTGTPYTFYDYINIRTDFTSAYATRARREATLFHEFGHSVRHVADGDESHWNWDNFRWAYARSHDGSEIFNVQYAFNEGWADYWSRARVGGHGKVAEGHPAGFLDWNEDMISNRLLDLSLRAGNDKVMVDVLKENAGSIHSLYEFETKLSAKLGWTLRPAPASCPPGYTDDGATCRLDPVIVAKPSYGRGVGTVPSSCGPGRQYDAGLCYDTCNAGFHPVGPVCWQSCPDGYSDDGATCRRGWDIFGKSSYGRGAGTVPSSCNANQELDAGLCYGKCAAGYHGVGPVCWGTCAAGFDDHGGTCHKAGSILVKY